MADEDDDKVSGWKEAVIGAASILEVAVGTGHPTEHGLEQTELEQQYASHYEQQGEERTAEANDLGFAIQTDEARPAEHEEPDNDSSGSWFALSDDDDDDDDDNDDDDD